jgi:hypothetical protein
LRTRIRRLSTNRIFVSRAEFKHTNSKVTVTLYIYNRQKNTFNKIRRLNTITGLRKQSFIRKIRLIKLQGLAIIKKCKSAKRKKFLLKHLFMIMLTLKTMQNSIIKFYCKIFTKRNVKYSLQAYCLL